MVLTYHRIDPRVVAVAPVKTRAAPAGESNIAMAKTNASDVWEQDLSGGTRARSTFMGRTLVRGVKPAGKTKVVRDDWDDDDDEEEEEEQEGNGDGENEKHGNANSLTASGTVNDGLTPALRALRMRDRAAEEDSSTIWAEANKRAPMPELIVAAASTGQSQPPPPPAALQPTLRILKRPPTTNTGANNSYNNTGAASSASLSSSSPGPTSGSSSGPSSGMTSPAPRGTLAEREAQYQEARSRIFGDKDKPGNVNSSSGSVSRTGSSSGAVVIVREPLGPGSEPEPESGVAGQDKTHGLGRPAKGFGERRRGKK